MSGVGYLRMTEKARIVFFYDAFPYVLGHFMLLVLLSFIKEMLSFMNNMLV